MRAALTLAALLSTSPAFAGGVGVLATGGVRTDTVYWYDANDEMAQIRQPQLLVLTGAGGEFLLGDRDDKILGVFRGYWLMVGPETDPAKLTSRTDAEVVANWREEPQHVGMGTVGVQWGFLGDPRKLQLNAVGSAGSGFLTSDHREFVQVELGLGGSYTFARSFQAHLSVVGTGMMRKTPAFGANVYGGIRYLID
jgi:hypothetical protein